MKKTINNILVPMPNLVHKGGICSYWSAMFNSFEKFSDINFEVIKVGNTGKNIFGPLLDQWRFHSSCKNNVDMVILNPIIENRAFFREGLFAKQLVKKKIPFITFFHSMSEDFEKRVRDKYIKFFLNSYGHAVKIITLSEDVKEKIIEWGYQGEVVVEMTVVDSRLIKNFSFDEKIQNQDFSKKIQLLFLARMEKEKGIFELIDAFKKLQQDFKNIELILAGDGTAYSDVKEYVADLKGIRLVGYVEGKEKENLFKKSDIYCLPSYSEGLPVSILEAMAFGLPVVTTRVGRLKDFFIEDKMGYTSKIKDSIDLEKVLRKLLANHDDISKIGLFNFEYAREFLMSDAISKRFNRHLTSIEE